MYPHVGVGTAMYSQAASPAGYYASAFTPMQAYYHPLAYTYPQPQLRPTIMIPVSYLSSFINLSMVTNLTISFFLFF